MMITFAIVAITMIIGLVLMQIGHGQTGEGTTSEPKGVFKSKAFTVKDLNAIKGDGYYNIQGTINNISNETITGIFMSVATYNATGNFNGVISHKVEPTMEPGEEYSFEITAYDLRGDLDHYIITMSSNR